MQIVLIVIDKEAQQMQTDYILIGTMKKKGFIQEFSKYLQISMPLAFNMILFLESQMNLYYYIE
jgi:hypothetical protein